MKIIAFILLSLFGTGLTIGAREILRRRDARRRDSERNAYRERQEAQRRQRAQANVELLIDRFFPFAKAAWEAAGPGDARERLRRVLAETNGITLGTADIGFDAVLPDTARPQHLLCLAKSGYGKTTIGLRLIHDDLRRRGLCVCVLGSEVELFRDWLLGMVPMERAEDVIYPKFSDPACTLTWNNAQVEDGEDRARAAGDLFSSLKQAVGETSIGARADAILSNALALLVGRPGATLLSVARLLEDEAYRSALVAETEDPYLRDFWTKTFPEYPAGAILPIVNRLNQFLRLPQLRASLCHPVSSFSVRDALEHDRILFFDVSGLDPDATRLLGQMLLSKFQIELMRRERIPEQERRPVHVYVDEFHVFAGAAEGTWRELLARGRRYGLALHLFTQHPNQLPRSLQHEIFGNVSSLIALNLSGADAAAVRRELLIPTSDGALKPIPAEELVSLPVGEGFARLGSGACALKVKFAEPIPKPDPRLGDRVREISWKTYAAPPLPAFPEPVPPPVAVGSSRPSSFASGIPVNVSTLGRGGGQHKILQRWVCEAGAARNFQAMVEQEILSGAGRVDVGLRRGDIRLGVEIAISNSPDEIEKAIVKCLAAGFTTVAILSPNETLLKKAADHVSRQFGEKDRNRVCFLNPDSFLPFLDTLPAPPEANSGAAGYRVEIKREGVSRGSVVARRRTLARLVGQGLLRRRWPS